jgi:hypothetical protein
VAIPADPYHVRVAASSAVPVDHAGHRDMLGTDSYPGCRDAFRVLHRLGLVAGEGREGSGNDRQAEVRGS